MTRLAGADLLLKKNAAAALSILLAPGLLAVPAAAMTKDPGTFAYATIGDSESFGPA